jgi:hypothetical protein
MLENQRFSAERTEKTSNKLGTIISLAIHLALFLLVIFGLPSIKKDAFKEHAITVDVLPITNKTNIKPQEQKVKNTEKIKEQIEPKKPEKPKEIPVEEIKPKEEEAKPKEEEKPKPKEEEKPKPKEEEKPKPKEDKKKSNNKKENKPKKKNIDSSKTKKKVSNENDLNLDKLLKDIELDEKNQENENQNEAKGEYDERLPLSISELDALNNYFINCWNPAIGVKDAGNLAVPLLISYNKDRSVNSIKIIEQGKYSSEPSYRIATDRAIQAVEKCSPVPEGIFSGDKYNTWKEIEYNFDPRSILN